MVKNYLRLIVAILFATNLVAQNIPSYVPTNGLVGWWPFNGSANDESGNGNHCTVNSSTLTKDRYGVVNSAYSFNGSSSSISSTFQFVKNNITLSFWFYTNATYLNGPNFIETSSQYCSINQNNGSIDFAQNTSAGNVYVNSGTFNLLDNWHNIIMIYTGDSAKLYIDGKLKDSKFSGGTLTPINNFILGKRPNNTGFFNGVLDDIIIWNRVLSEQEISSVFKGCLIPSVTITPQGSTTFCEGGNVNLNATIGANYTYQWYNNNQAINGANTSIYQARTSGNYIVKITDGFCNAASSATSVTVNPLPTVTITPQGNTTFCQGGFVNLEANGGTSYQWNTSSTSASISATQSGTYTVNVFNQYNCQATASQVVTVNPLPNVVMNTLNQFTLKNTTPIQLVANPSGGTFSGDGVQGTTFNPSLTTLGTKTISYNYTSPQGCSGNAVRRTIVVDSIGNVCSTYDTLKIKVKLTTGINTNQYTSMRVYPNPTSDVLVIDAADVQALNGYRYRILDILGKEVYNALVTSAKTEISLKSLDAKGVYVLHIMDANNASIQTKQIVLE
jgi:hypothetical protein